MRRIVYRVLVVLLSLQFSIQSFGQDIGLDTGKLIPDFALGKVINGNVLPATTAGFKDRLLIIDFWATSCSGCVAALPKMQKLQEHFGDKLAILPVTYEKEALVKAFWARNRYTKALTLPSVVEDVAFSKHFKHHTIPHEIWVYKGRVVGITGPDYVDSANISRVLSGARVNWPVKNDFYVFDGRKERLFKPNPSQVDTANTFIDYAAISDYRPGVNSSGFSGGSGMVRDPLKKTVRTYFLNQPIYNSYFMAWTRIKGLDKNALVRPAAAFTLDPEEIIWEVEDRAKYRYDKAYGYEQDWIRRNGICFESVHSDRGQDDREVYRKMVQDMNMLLGLNVRWEKRKEQVWVLKRNGKGGFKHSFDIRSGQKISSSESRKGTLYNFEDWSINSLRYRIQQENPKTYVFDETGYGEMLLVDMTLNIPSWKDRVGLNKALVAYGLELKVEERMVDRFVFSEVNGGLLVEPKLIDSAKFLMAGQESLVNPDSLAGKAFIAENSKKPGVIVLPSGLQYKVIKMGKGQRPQATDQVKVNYIGRLVNGKIFDSSLQTGRPAVLTLSNRADSYAMVIPGMFEALQLMPVGSKWELYIPANLAYGNRTNYGKLERGSALIFEVELLDIVKKEEGKPGTK